MTSTPSPPIRKDAKRANAFWARYVAEHWPVYLMGIFTVFCTNFLQVYITRTMGLVIDLFSGKTAPLVRKIFFFVPFEIPALAFQWLFGLLVTAQFLIFLARIGWRFTLARQTHYAGSMLRQEVWKSVRFFPKKKLDTEFTKGMLLNVSNSDVSSAKFLFGFTLVGITDFLFLTSMSLAAMLMIHVSMALWSLVALVLCPVVMKRISEREIQLYDRAQDKLSEFNDLGAQAVASIRLQRLTQTGKFWNARLLKMAEDYRVVRFRAVMSTLRWFPAMGAISLFSYVILFVQGIRFIKAGEMSVGDFISMQALIALIQEPLTELGMIISEWRKGMTGLMRLQHVFHEPPDHALVGEGDTTIAEAKSQATGPLPVLEVEGLGFQFPGSARPLFQNLSFKLMPAERLGITGQIGSGKSVLVQILSGLERSHEGQVRFQGQAYGRFSHPELRGYIGMVPQQSFLFAASVRHNVALDLGPKLTDDDIWKALEIAGLTDDVKAFPHQLDTELGEWGINLSGGQKQRLSLARAIVRAPRLLLLDDCLSAVDTVTEEKILMNLDREMRDTTLVWVAHRPSTLKYCHHHLELAHGR